MLRLTFDGKQDSQDQMTIKPDSVQCVLLVAGYSVLLASILLSTLFNSTTSAKSLGYMELPQSPNSYFHINELGTSTSLVVKLFDLTQAW
jgi:hypothetical protein